MYVQSGFARPPVAKFALEAFEQWPIGIAIPIYNPGGATERIFNFTTRRRHTDKYRTFSYAAVSRFSGNVRKF